MADDDICAKCGKKDKEHPYWLDPTSDDPHIIIKWSDERSKAQSLLVKKWHLNDAVRGVLLICKKYNGCCIENNFCFALERKHPGDFGWGECIHCITAPVCYWSVRKHTWKVNMDKLIKWLNENNWLNKNNLNGFLSEGEKKP